MLSGYVMGLTYKKEDSAFDSLLYLKKRILRLYPIYLVAVLICVPLFERKISTLVGVLFFLQNITDNLYMNQPLWSLNYEMLYYLLFVPLLVWRVSVKALFPFILLIGLSSYFFPTSPLVSSYAIGYLFWLSGLAMAWYLPHDNQVLSSSKLLSCIALLFSVSLWDNLAKSLFSFITIPKEVMISVWDLIYFPLAFPLLLIVSGKNYRGKKYIEKLPYLLVGLGMIYCLSRPPLTSDQVISIASFVISLLLASFIHLKLPIEKLAALGSISYALYVMHMPIMFYVSSISSFSGPYFLPIRLLFYLAVVLTTSYLLEKKYQLYIRDIFIRKRR